MQAKEEQSLQVSRWSNRFIWAAIIQGFAATLLTIPIVDPYLNPPVSKVIAGGSAGTWFLVGYVMYIVVGVIAVGLTALFYYHFEVSMKKPYVGISNALAWIHLILMNAGAATATYLLMYGGYMAGAGMLPVSEGGKGWTALQAHINVLSALVDPTAYAIVITGVGVLAGGLGFLLNYLRK
jgi:heme/copper-type cytochrome/quinol oxidase subunit 1